MKKFDLSAIMRKAWKLYRKGVAAFSECLHRAWNSAKAEPINAQRIEEAQQAAGITGIVLTKLDGTAKGGIVIAIARELGVPVKFAGVGEGIDDLKPFDAEDYVKAII